jgi:hypothetical protein
MRVAWAGLVVCVPMVLENVVDTPPICVRVYVCLCICLCLCLCLCVCVCVCVCVDTICADMEQHIANKMSHNAGA